MATEIKQNSTNQYFDAPTPRQLCEKEGGKWINGKCIRAGGTQAKTPPTTLREQQQEDAIQTRQRGVEAKEREKRNAAKIDAPLFGEGGVSLDDFQSRQDKRDKASTAEGRGFKDGVAGFYNKEGKFFPEEMSPDNQQIIFDNETGKATGVIQPSGASFLGGDVAQQVQLQSGAVAADSQAQQDLSGQVGQFGELGVGATPFDQSALAGAAARGLIPAAIRAAQGAALGGIGGAQVGAIGGPVGAITLAALGFAGGIASSILGEMAGQRTDNTNAQQRVLDEGKQVLNDWITYAEANPSDSKTALAGFNQQLALINQAHRQMKLDTSKDLAAFENAIPNLAEFNSFYSLAGERDIYLQEMAVAMSGVSSVDTRMLALIAKRGGQ